MGKVKIDNYTAKEAMKLVLEYMQLESVQTIEMITPDILKYYQNDSEASGREWNEDAFNLTFASSRSILEAVGITDDRLLREADSHLFMKMFVQFLHKNRAKVFLLAENGDVLALMREYIVKYSSGVRVVGTATMEEHGVSDDMILNLINGVEADCILAALPSPDQQDFMIRNRLSMNARVWVGLGTRFMDAGSKKTVLTRVKDFFNRHFTKK